MSQQHCVPVANHHHSLLVPAVCPYVCHSNKASLRSQAKYVVEHSERLHNAASDSSYKYVKALILHIKACNTQLPMNA